MSHHPENRPITIHVSDRVYAGLIEAGRKAGYTPAFYAKLLFDAAYAARCGKGEADPLLDACVTKSVVRNPVLPTPTPSRTVPPAAVCPAPHRGEIADPPPLPLVRLPAITAPAPHVAKPTPSAGAADRVPSKPTATTKGWPSSHAIFARLVCREEGASRQEIMAAVYPAYRDRNGLFVLVSNVRKRLEAAGVRLEVVDIWGWRTSPRSAAQALAGRLG